VLITRLATAAVGIPLIVLTIWVGGGLLAGVTAAAVFIAVIEFANARGAARTPIALLAAALAATLPAAALAGHEWLSGATVLTLVALVSAFVLARDPAADVEGWLWATGSALYFGALAAHFVFLRELANGRDWLLFVVLVVWMTDTGAYAVGHAVGRHKLAPAISPGKTVEGAIGGMIAGFAAVFALDTALDLGLALEHRIALGLLLPAVTQTGDLAESAMKRALGVKDSSGLVPGHGGIADRLDSLLFAAPALYYYLRWLI
jgi:phosphatidate cytidylyltransferase